MIALFDAQPVKCYSELTLISSGCRLSRVSTLSSEFWAFLKQSAGPINFGHKGGLQSWNKRAFLTNSLRTGVSVVKHVFLCVWIMIRPRHSYLSRIFATKYCWLSRRKSERACIDFATYYTYMDLETSYRLQSWRNRGLVWGKWIARQ